MTTKTTAATQPKENLPATLDLYAGFTDEEKAELLGVSGQANSLRGDKIPNLKVNYCDVPDREGRTIKKGNYVLGQNTSEIEVEVEGEDGPETELRIEDVGIDLGKAPRITVLFSGQQYSFYHDDPKKRCSSQLILDNSEVPIGNNLKKECRSKTDPCPRRAEGVDAKEKCSCQHVVFNEVKDSEGNTHKSVMYLKGKSYMPFSDYLKAAGINPVYFFPTKLTNKMEKQGSVNYWVTTPELLVNEPYPELERKANFQTAKEAKQGALDFKAQQEMKSRQKQLGGRGAGSGVSQSTIIKNDDVVEIEFD